MGNMGLLIPQGFYSFYYTKERHLDVVPVQIENHFVFSIAHVLVRKLCQNVSFTYTKHTPAYANKLVQEYKRILVLVCPAI